MQFFQNALDYFATAISYKHKMFYEIHTYVRVIKLFFYFTDSAGK